MTPAANFVAIDLGASSGRVMAGCWNGERFALDELHRFPNGGVSAGGRLYWNALGIWSEIQTGLARYLARFAEAPRGIGIDAWGVDFALIDQGGRLLSNPRHYRDPRTDGIAECVFRVVPEERIFAETGVLTMPINTLFQLYSMVVQEDATLAAADRLMMIPDLFTWLLSGDRIVEYTEATTTQMYSPTGGDWCHPILSALKIPSRILPPPTAPGTVLSPLRPALAAEWPGAKAPPVIAVASHDTASAVAAIPAMDAGSVFLSSGTWSLMGVEATAPDVSGEALRLGFTNEGGAGGTVLLVKNLTGMWIAQECLRHWAGAGREYSPQEFARMAEQAPPFGSFIDPGARQFQAPCDMPAAIRRYAVATGQRPPESDAEIARSTFESLSLKYRSVLESLRRLTGRALGTIRVVGGGSLNPLLCQMTADACGCEVVAGPAEASALGNVMLQAVATGHLGDLAAGRAAIARSVDCSRFEPRRPGGWEDAYARFRALESRQITGPAS